MLSLSRSRPFGLHLGGGNSMDGVQAARLAGYERPALIWLDAKHGDWGTKSLNPQEIRSVLDQLKELDQKPPGFIHLLRVAINKSMPSAAEIAKGERRVWHTWRREALPRRAASSSGQPCALAPTEALNMTSRSSSS